MIKTYFKQFLLLIGFTLLFTQNYWAQDIVVKVKKGTVKFKGKAKSSSDQAFVIGQKDSVYITSGALAVARKGTTVVELTSGKKYSYKAINSAISKKKASSTGNFSDVVFNDKIQKPAGKVYGSTTRSSGERLPNHMSPEREVVVICDTLHIEFGNDWTNPSTAFTLMDAVTMDTVQSISLDPEAKQVVLADLKEGKYKWNVTVRYREENKSVFLILENTFSVPAEEYKTNARQELQQFKNECADFSKELMEELLSEFLYFKNWHPGIY
jgi:hypothetical protein